MDALAYIIPSLALAGICGFLCAKCHPRYVFKHSAMSNCAVDGVPDAYTIKSIFYKFKRVDAESFARICEAVKLMGINEYVYKDYSVIIPRFLKTPIGYILSLINFSLIAFPMRLPLPLMLLWLAVFLVSLFIFSRNNEYVETADMRYPGYSITSETSPIEDVEKLEDVLNTTGAAAKARVENARRMMDAVSQWRTIYLIFTLIAAYAIHVLH